MNQPGVEVADFQTLTTPVGEGVKWEHLKDFSSRGATIGSFPRLEEALDLDWLERIIEKSCRTKRIRANTKEDPMFESYVDTNPRLIRIDLPPLTSTSDAFTRDLELQKNDELLFELFKLTPSPRYFLIYTSTTGERYDPESATLEERYYDIFPDIVRAKRDPRNRATWKNHELRKPKTSLEEPIQILPPLAVKERNDKLKKLKKSKAQDKNSSSSVSDVLSLEKVVLLVGANLFIVLVLLLRNFLKWTQARRIPDEHVQGSPNEKSRGTSSAIMNGKKNIS